MTKVQKLVRDTLLRGYDLYPNQPLFVTIVASLDLAALHKLFWKHCFYYSNLVTTETQSTLFQKLMIPPLSNAHEDRAITS